MKKTILIQIIILCLILLLTGCNEKEKIKIETKMQEVNALNDKTNYRINGAKDLIIEVREAYNKNDEEKLLKAAGELHINFENSPEDIEAQQYVKPIIETKQKEIERMNEIGKEKEKKAIEEELKQKEERKEVKRKQEEAVKKERENELKGIIRVNAVYPYDMDYYGGTDLIVNFVNNSDKIIKYITFYCQPFNAVGDPVSCEIQYESALSMSHLSEGAFESTGPYAKGEGIQGTRYRWAKAWYNSTIKTVKLNKVKIEYMDGSEELIEGEEDISYIMY